MKQDKFNMTLDRNLQPGEVFYWTAKTTPANEGEMLVACKILCVTSMCLLIYFKSRFHIMYIHVKRRDNVFFPCIKILQAKIMPQLLVMFKIQYKCSKQNVLA